jgi:hypothetical protein
MKTRRSDMALTGWLYNVMKIAPGSGFGIRIQRALKLKQSKPSAATRLANSTLRPINFDSESRIPNPGKTSGRRVCIGTCNERYTEMATICAPSRLV